MLAYEHKVGRKVDMSLEVDLKSHGLGILLWGITTMRINIDYDLISAWLCMTVPTWKGEKIIECGFATGRFEETRVTLNKYENPCMPEMFNLQALCDICQSERLLLS